jgi:predicted nucleotide-binding protein
LAESLPQVVTKLQEGRSKRLKKLDQQAIDSKKQIEQRSQETCIMNSTHLEEFQVKAKVKLETSHQDWAASMSAIKALVKQLK